MRLYNTRTKIVEELPKPTGRPLNFFACGPTVYGDIHLGNFRTYIVFDSLIKFLASQGQPVFYLQNITDIDDKIITRAEEEGISPAALAKKYLLAYEKAVATLNITAVNVYAPATNFIPEIILQVTKLIESGNAYVIEGDGYYFDLNTFPDYGKLSGRTIAQAEDGVSRIDASDKKRNRGDFCVWKFSKAGEPMWDAPFGAGRPGWHIEDTAISDYYFGPQYDMHGAGMDLMFPHHEAEIAQQESISHKKPFVAHWMHIGMLTRDGKKMSKSLGNFVTLDDALKQISPNALRLFFLSHEYRTPMDFSEQALLDAGKAWSAIKHFLARLQFVARRGNTKHDGSEPPTFSETATKFVEHLTDDFGTPRALAALFSFMNEIQPALYTLTRKEAQAMHVKAIETLALIGFIPKEAPMPLGIRLKAMQRETKRKNKDFAAADALRKKVEGLGYVLEDTPLGPLVLRK